jgi:hypothetical protein
MSRVRPLARRVAVLVLAAVAVACAEPPTREISQAQGALDAARAAGADTYATAEFQAADAALQRAHAAVAVRDYRQALSSALEAREQARVAAREASVARARAATDVAQAIQAAARGVAAAKARLTGMSREHRARLTTTLDTLTAQLQEARSAVAAGDYARAAERTRGIETQLAAVVAQLPKAR